MKYDLSERADIYIAKGRFAKYLNEGKRIELKVWRAKRTNRQNAYLHVCLGFVAQETGYTIEEAKTLMKRQFGRYLVYQKNGETFYKTTAELDTLQLTEFIEYIRHTASESLGVYIPTPEQYYEDQFEIEKHLESIL